MKTIPAKGRKEQTRAARSAGSYILIGTGVLVILLGLYTMFRPNLLMPAKRENLQIGGQRVLMETRRIVEVPRAVSALVIFCGAGLIFMGIQQP